MARKIQWLRHYWRVLTTPFRQMRYPGSAAYWERRYAQGGHSGSGSSGAVARFKADFLNDFVAKNAIHSVVELGCGDGQQLQLAVYPPYKGLDIAPSAIQRCRELFKADKNKVFDLYNPETYCPEVPGADLSISLEVIFHLTEDVVYLAYLRHLFDSSARWVIVFSSNATDNTHGIYPHYKPRRFTDHVPADWVLKETIVNPFPEISASSFFVFEKIG